MKIKELIEELQKYDQEAEVIVQYPLDDGYTVDVGIKDVYRFSNRIEIWV